MRPFKPAFQNTIEPLMSMMEESSFESLSQTETFRSEAASGKRAPATMSNVAVWSELTGSGQRGHEDCDD